MVSVIELFGYDVTVDTDVALERVEAVDCDVTGCCDDVSVVPGCCDVFPATGNVVISSVVITGLMCLIKVFSVNYALIDY